jgi:hypothetical protein
MIEAVVRRGVTPEPAVIEGDTVPDHKIVLVPPPLLPVLHCEIVPAPPVPAGKSMFATGVMVPEDSVHPAVLRDTDTRV